MPEQDRPTDETADRPRLIVVDDEPDLRQALAEYLTRHGFVVHTAPGGAALDALLGEEDADLLILDVNMPGEDGLAIARRIRSQRELPILMLTAADEVVDRVVGLEIGADDYMTKPFDLRELRARIRALLRRSRTTISPQEPVSRTTLPPTTTPMHDCTRGVRFGRTWLDMDARCLLQSDGAPIELTAMEFDLLNAFAQNPNRVLTRDRLLDLAHNRNWEPFDRSIDIRIARLRRKVEDDPAKPQVIRTMRGAGYMFVPNRG